MFVFGIKLDQSIVTKLTLDSHYYILSTLFITAHMPSIIIDQFRFGTNIIQQSIEMGVVFAYIAFGGEAMRAGWGYQDD